MRLILTLEYDGTPFRGWAAQPGLPTVEAALRWRFFETSFVKSLGYITLGGAVIAFAGATIGSTA